MLEQVQQYLTADIRWSMILSNLGLILTALLITLPIAYNREKKSSSAGLRTYPLVAVATCSYTLIAMNIFEDTESLSRYMAGIITGIGFIGGGAILKAKDNAQVNGLATAASIWNTGSIGIAVAWEMYEIAIIISLINFIVLSYGSDAKKIINGED